MAFWVEDNLGLENKKGLTEGHEDSTITLLYRLGKERKDIDKIHLFAVDDNFELVAPKSTSFEARLVAKANQFLKSIDGLPFYADGHYRACDKRTSIFEISPDGRTIIIATKRRDFQLISI